MVLIPAGDFQMGHDPNATTSPVHTVYVDAFLYRRTRGNRWTIQSICS